MKATTRDLRLRANELLSATDRGETVVITYRGRRRAVLHRWPGEPPASAPERNPAFGIWADRTDDVNEYVRRARARRALP